MKILHINCNYLTTVLHQTMIEHLDKEGVESVVFAPTYDLGRAVIKPNSNVVTVQCFKKWDRLWYQNKQRKIISALEKSLDAKSFDCIHAYTLFTDGNCAMSLSQKYGKPYVVAVRDTDVNYFFRLMPHLRSRGVEIMLRSARVFFLSSSYKELVLDKYVPEKYREIIEKKSIIVPNGIDDFWFDNENVSRNLEKTAQEIENKNIKMIFAGRINSNKNPLTTLKAIDELEARGYNVQFTVAGGFEDGSLKSTLLSDSRVNYVGKLTKEALIEHYRDSDIFVMPSHFETFGLVYAEAMSQGLPVLYTRGQGFDKNFEDGEVGYAIDSHSPQDIADKTVAVCQNYADISRRCTEKFKKFMEIGLE